MAFWKEIRVITRKRPCEQQRLVIANDWEFNRMCKYATNFVQTSKYNLISFLPVNLFQQFRRLANFYFLVLTAVQWTPVSSLNPLTTAIPLVIVLIVSAAKDAYDDIQRHKSDKKVNNRTSTIVRSGKTIQEKWQTIQVGDVVRMENGDFVAADILLLSSSEPDGMCYIETAELDGETNLKAKQALHETALMEDDLSKISAFNGKIVFGPPSNFLPPKAEAFQGRLTWNDTDYVLSNEQMLLRGCVIRNTKWCYGVVVFAGRDTKLMMNSGKQHFKRTSLDGFMNALILGILIFLGTICVICVCLCEIWEYVYGSATGHYLPPNTLNNFFVLFSYMILMSTVVPMSLYVSVEVLRGFHSLMINWDREMYYEKTDTCALARTTTLNEELGQIHYIFSDKTGTLTQNIMTFNKCSINGVMYGDVLDETGNPIDPLYLQPLDLTSNKWSEKQFRWYDPNLQITTQTDSVVKIFWRLLALCHTVMPEWKSDDTLEYQAQSPDEAALVAAARNFGFVFKNRNTNTITIEISKNGSSEGREEIYELLSILDFDNTRKRMSVLVRRNGVTTLFCKGADDVIFDLLSQSDINARLKFVTQSHLNSFAKEGLRTLALAYKIVDKRVCDEWMTRHRAMSMLMKDRREKLAELYEEIETEMTLIGATAIEDKLQDGVPNTIANLAKARIKLWVLTGDKQETAINIGYSSHLLTSSMKIFCVNGDQFEHVQEKLQSAKEVLVHYRKSLEPKPVSIPEEIRATSLAVPRTSIPRVSSQTTFYDTCGPETGNALVIDGQSLVHALDKRLHSLFLEVAIQCRAVICCRVTPSQKAAVVNLVKKKEKAVTLAIGDGANDVPMIKSAHIGVGISGQEGMQAVLASDYSVAQFRFLERLLLVHGRWSYFRMAKFMCYFFYKNFAFTLTQFWFAFFTGYSAQTLFDDSLITFYNVLFTALPVMAVGILDQDVNDKNSLSYPLLYTPGPSNQLFNMRAFSKALLHGIFVSLAAFFIAYGAMIENTDVTGRNTDDLGTFGFTVMSAIVVSVNGQIALDTDHWTYLNFLFILLSFIGFLLLSIIYYEAFPHVIGDGSIVPTALCDPSVFGAMNSSTYWLTILLITAVNLLPVIAIRYYYNTMEVTLMHRVRAKQRLENRKGTAQVSMANRSANERIRKLTVSSIGDPSPQLPPKPMWHYAHRHQLSTFSMPAFNPDETEKRQGFIRRKRTQSLRSGYAFSHEYGFGERITSGVLRMHSSQMGSKSTVKSSLPEQTKNGKV